MTHQGNKQASYTTTNSSSNGTSSSSVATNPRIVQLDTLLTRSRFIWDREHSQQASNNN